MYPFLESLLDATKKIASKISNGDSIAVLKIELQNVLVAEIFKNNDFSEREKYAISDYLRGYFYCFNTFPISLERFATFVVEEILSSINPVLLKGERSLAFKCDMIDLIKAIFENKEFVDITKLSQEVFNDIKSLGEGVEVVENS